MLGDAAGGAGMTASAVDRSEATGWARRVVRRFRMNGREALLHMMRGLGRRLAAEMERQVVDETRIASHMNQAGYEAEVFFRSSGTPEIVAHNCVFHHLAATHPEVCELDLALIGTLGGGEVEHLECMVRQGQVCRFRLKRSE